MLDRAVRLFHAAMRSKEVKKLYFEACQLIARIDPEYLDPNQRFRMKVLIFHMSSFLGASQGNVLAGQLIQSMYSDFSERQYIRQHAEFKKIPALYFQGKFLEAMELTDRLAEADLSPVKVNSAAIRILLGRWKEGWQRMPDDKFFEDMTGIPTWSNQSLRGRSILICLTWAGFGDAINFCWLINVLQDMGAARVAIAVKPPIVNLLRSSGFDVVLEHEGKNFDYITSETGMLKSLDFCPAKYPAPSRYLRIPKRSTAPIPKDDRLNVALIWGTSTFADEIEQRKLKQWFPYRSIPLAQMAEHFQQFDMPGIRFFSVCHNPTEIGFDAEAYPNLIDLSPYTKAFEDMAAAIDELDLLISVDTLHAHIGGALNKPTWTLLPVGCDWRWGLNSDRTHWYKSMKLFRQAAPEDWGKPLSDVAEELQKYADDSHQSRRFA